MPQPVLIRSAVIHDLNAITEIYNDAILTTTATFDTEPKTVSEQTEWFENHGVKYPILVAELDQKIVGWASLSKWSDRCAYAETAELSLYVKSEHRNKGIGKKLMEDLMVTGKQAGLHTVLARIVSENQISIELHKKFGFETVGTMKEVGQKFGRLLDVTLMQKMLKS
ncbi:MAG: N-acetyltransferase family protein [Planctomycetes bacterium]|nr:N-acetyltransferase family protein [Planctomycetota bacterium]